MIFDKELDHKSNTSTAELTLRDEWKNSLFKGPVRTNTQIQCGQSVQLSNVKPDVASSNQ
jgi:hypothetical protein